MLTSQSPSATTGRRSISAIRNSCGDVLDILDVISLCGVSSPTAYQCPNRQIFTKDSMTSELPRPKLQSPNVLVAHRTPPGGLRQSTAVLGWCILAFAHTGELLRKAVNNRLMRGWKSVWSASDSAVWVTDFMALAPCIVKNQLGRCHA